MFGELKGATVRPKLSQTVNRIQLRKGWHTTVAFFGWIEEKSFIGMLVIIFIGMLCGHGTVAKIKKS